MQDYGDIARAKQDLRVRLLDGAAPEPPPTTAWLLRVQDVLSGLRTNAHGLGIGRKVVEGRATDQLAIRVHVSHKVSTSLIPAELLIPKEIDGHPTDVVQSAPPMAMLPPAQSDPNRRAPCRPVRGGISAAQRDVTAGTIACFCRSTRFEDDPAQIYALSNNHVFANGNRGLTGDQIYQQSPIDGGGPQDAIGRLARFVPMATDGIVANAVDCALATVDAGVSIDTAVAGIGELDGIAEAELRMAVRKHGRSSGYTEGIVSDVQYDTIVAMDPADPRARSLFTNQIRIERVAPFDRFAEGGDSGSLIVARDTPRAVGLFFAGAADGSYGIANHIGDVFDALDVELWPNATEPGHAP